MKKQTKTAMKLSVIAMIVSAFMIAGGLHRNSAETKDTWCNIYGREQYDY